MGKFEDGELEKPFLHQGIRNMPGWLPATLLIVSGSLIVGRSLILDWHNHMVALMLAALLLIARVVAAVLFKYRPRQIMLWEMVFQTT